MIFSHWFSDLLNVAFPPVCHICGAKLAPHERFACSHCLAQLPRTGYHRRRMNPMEERFAGQFPFEKATGHFFYSRESALSQLLQDLKYRHFPDVGRMLGEIIARELLPTGFFSGIDLILPMPIHRLKQARRGYNQTHLIAGGISEITGIPVSFLLKATRPHRTQTSLSREERLANTSGIFALESPASLSGKGVILLDDVCTTGATLSSAASVVTAACPDVRLTLLSVGVTF